MSGAEASRPKHCQSPKDCNCLTCIPPRLGADPLVRLEECRAERNQCDGCQAGIPLEKGPYGGLRHRMGKAGGYPDHMSCTAKDYGHKVFDEAAERVDFEIWANKKAMKHGYQFMEHLLLRNDDGTYRTCWVDNAYDGWLACARSRHNESTMQGEGE